jgi:hypothetical protein
MEKYYSKKNKVLLGNFYSSDNILNDDMDGYDIDTGDIIFLFRKKTIPTNYYDIHKGIISQSKTVSANRGNAAGRVTVDGLVRGKEHWKAYPVALCDKNGNPRKKESSSSFFIYNDGRVSKRARSNTVASQSIGGFDKSPMHPCRLTHWTSKNLYKYKSIFPLCKYISDRYFEYFPDKWLHQYEIYENSPQDFVIPDTNFSTITLNNTFRTAAHQDKGDCKKGLTCFTIKKIGEYKGGELCFPEYDIAINVQEGDLLIFNPHIIHCNNELEGEGRMSFVFYLREKMNQCHSSSDVS